MDKLLALGGDIPEISLVTPKVGKNAWEGLLMDLEEEKLSYAELLEAMHLADDIDPELAEGLRRIREAEQQHREEILEMLVKRAIPTPGPKAPVGEPPQESHTQGRGRGRQL